MSSIFGKNLRISIAGESHGEALGVIIDGLPAGFPIDMEALSAFLKRRAPGQNRFSTPRKEGDVPRFLSGILNGVTTGAPVLAVIPNTNVRSGDYAPFAHIPRPGHADYTGTLKYGGFADLRGGGHFSGRLTAPLCIAGGIAKEILREKGIFVFAHIHSVFGIEGKMPGYTPEELPALLSMEKRDFPVWDTEAGEKMQAEIDKARSEGDSVGGVCAVGAMGLPAGLGAPMFDRLESRLSAAIFGIPAVRGIGFGNGFDCARLRGSQNNDAFSIDKAGKVYTKTNRAGGVLGGITTGMPLHFTVAIKPTPTISCEQESVDLEKMEPVTLKAGGRHDPCILPRAVPVLEAATALVLLDFLLDGTLVRKGEEHGE